MAIKIQKKTICPLDCPDTCGMLATVEDGRVVALHGDKDHPYTAGFICRKMRRYPERLYCAQRILYPQLRVGRKGAGEFRRIDWQQALDILAARLKAICQQYGGESILPYSYAGNMGAVNRFAGYPFFHRLGTSRLDQTICSAASGAGWQKQCGNLPGCPPENAADAELIVAWGINIKVTNVHFWRYVTHARKKGARLLVIDPYCNQTGKAADNYLQVKPGGDSGLALGVMKSLIEKNKIDQQFIDRHTEGFAQQAAYVMARDWESFVSESGVAKDEIEELAALLAGAPRTFFRIGIGLSRNSRGGMSVRAIASLAACLGLFAGGKGRGVLLSSGAFRGDKGKLTYPDLASAPTRIVNMIQLGHALTALDPPVKALIVYNSNPMSVNPDGAMVRRGLQREDLFTVVHEQVMTPTAKYADLLLPATIFLENLDVYTGYGHFYLGVAQPAIEPVGEAWSNFKLFQSLALKMGFNEPVFQQSCEERIVDYLTDMPGFPAGCAVQDVLAGSLVHSAYSSVDGRVLADGTHTLRLLSPNSVPEPTMACLTAAGEFGDPDLQSRYPFRLITPPHPDLLNSTFGEFYPGTRGSVLVHPEDAAMCQVQDGDTVRLSNGRGQTKRLAKVTTDTGRGVLVAEGIFWPVEEDAEVAGNGSENAIHGGINDLTSQKLTDMGGGATFHESLVSLAKI
ncbi:molybdopterin oxidoreductase [Desulfopila sp. IMCC35006]|uniref:molybdopterin-containing oxidoreductase family protein n=1 Tax=Desulfopila sp. IMCC35006 TaxID=2569542 RepID=UPI0010AC7B1E|nr:molybdopterin-dependent oxidoreductase [Desulfopila sp. IMCC35006]TKB23790.1 molybdopterin oxidoreductase [Desulfopila sp. IMCC35006]